LSPIVGKYGVTPRKFGSLSQGPLRILWVDDHPLLLKGAIALLRSRWPALIAQECGNLAEARRHLADRLHWDLVVLDLTLPDGDGRELLPLLHKVMVFSVYGNANLYRELRTLGVSGAACKAHAPQELLEIAQAVLEGREAFPKISSEGLDEVFLTNRESEVLRSLVHGESPGEIAKAMGLSSGTIQTYRKRLCGKLGVASTAELVRVAVEKGYF